MSHLEKFYKDLNDKLFPGGQSQRNKEAQDIKDLSNNKLTIDESLDVLLGTSALFSVAEDKSDARLIRYINKKTSDKLDEHEATVIVDFIHKKFLSAAVVNFIRTKLPDTNQ